MFTGIIEKQGLVRSFDRTEPRAGLELENAYRDLQIGESVAVNGVSLILSQVRDVSEETTEIILHLIPHTWKETGFSSLELNRDHLNIETDLFAKYMERLCQPYLKR